MKIPSRYFYVQRHGLRAFGAFTEAKEYNLYCSFENFDSKINKYIDLISKNEKSYHPQILEVVVSFSLYPCLWAQAVKALKESEDHPCIRIDLIKGSYEKIAERINE